jgi:hypothetical protein
VTPEVTVTVLGRLGWANRIARIDVRGLTATESAIRFGTTTPDASVVTERSFPTTSVVDAVLSLLPPRPDFRTSDRESIQAAWEAIATFARAPDGVPASYAKSILRWDAVPECVRSLQHSVAAEFLVITDGSKGQSLRWWLSGDSGWVGMSLSGGNVSMVPSSLADIRYDLLVDLVDAVTG